MAEVKMETEMKPTKSAQTKAVEAKPEEGTAASAQPAEGVVKPARKKVKRLVKDGLIFITAGYNNTLLSATDPHGAVVARSSSGASGFKGTKKSTPYAAQVAAERLIEKLEPFGMEKVRVYVKGIGPGREQSIRGLAKTLQIELIIDRTAVPHNGCRPKKKRRV